MFDAQGEGLQPRGFAGAALGVNSFVLFVFGTQGKVYSHTGGFTGAALDVHKFISFASCCHSG